VAQIDRTRTIAAAPQEVWEVTHGADGPIGTARRVQMGRQTLVERIVEFEPPHALAYDIEGLPKRLAQGQQPMNVATVG
jgi:hypothetical protein